MAAGAESEYLVGADRVGLARERLWRTRHQTHLVMHQLGGGSTDQEGPGRRLLGQPGRVPGGIAHCGVDQTLCRAQPAEQDLSRMEPQTDAIALPRRPRWRSGPRP